MAIAAPNEAPNLLEQLLRDQEQRQGRFDVQKDSLEMCVEKTLRRRSLTVDKPFSMLNQIALKTPLVWPALIANEGLAATSGIQAFLRSFSAATHLCTQMCNIVHTVANIQALAKLAAVKDGVVFEAVLPLLLVLEEMLAYVQAKSAGRTTGQSASIAQGMAFKTPVDKAIEKARNHGFTRDGKKAGGGYKKKQFGRFRRQDSRFERDSDSD